MYNLKNVKYKNILKIENMSFERGEISFITGKSGSGKTTLLKLLNRMLTPESGEILFNGINIEDMEPVALRRRAAMLPQAPVLFEGNVEHNLSAGVLFSEKPLPAKEAMTEALETVMLDKKLNESPENFSGGEKQRLSLARIILQDPEVFLLDEPSSSLDKKTEDIVMGNVIDYMRSRKKTAIIVSHSTHIAEKFSGDIKKINERGAEENL